ncbi:MAG: Gfo/Idh/MocA family oxidoreductase [Bacteroidetes bacterium]|nr:Gfo/Idh/MocA family oxidoreductase [Bacteroidota bacterium]
MKKQQLSRLSFIKNVTMAGAAISLTSGFTSLYGRKPIPEGKRIGMIGLDTSHCISFAKLLNATPALPEYEGYRITCAYPRGSWDIKASVDRIPEYTEKIKAYGVEVVDSIDKVLQQVDVVVLLTNDGRVHLEQVIPVFKAGKPVYIDKPMTASLRDAIEIFDLGKQYNVPVFSCSALRYVSNLQEIAKGKFGKVLGADTFSPAPTEKTHPDLFWYGIHGVELLYTAMGKGCKKVVRVHTDSTDLVVGTWGDGRIGSVRGTRTGKHIYGGIVQTDNGAVVIDEFQGYSNLVKAIVEFFKTGISPIDPQETLELLAYMEAADLSKKRGGSSVKIETMFKRARHKK